MELLQLFLELLGRLCHRWFGIDGGCQYDETWKAHLTSQDPYKHQNANSIEDLAKGQEGIGSGRLSGCVITYITGERMNVNLLVLDLSL